MMAQRGLYFILLKILRQLLFESAKSNAFSKVIKIVICSEHQSTVSKKLKTLTAMSYSMNQLKITLRPFILSQQTLIISLKHLSMITISPLIFRWFRKKIIKVRKIITSLWAMIIASRLCSQIMNVSKREIFQMPTFRSFTSTQILSSELIQLFLTKILSTV